MNKIRIYRLSHNLTQQELADKVQVSRQTINNIEQSKFIPRLALLCKIAEIFKVSVTDLI